MNEDKLTLGFISQFTGDVETNTSVVVCDDCVDCINCVSIPDGGCDCDT